MRERQICWNMVIGRVVNLLTGLYMVYIFFNSFKNMEIRPPYVSTVDKLIYYYFIL